MAKLTKKEFAQKARLEASGGEATEHDKKALVAQVYKWQQSENIYAWEEEDLQKDLGIGIQGATLSTVNEDGVLVEVDFLRDPEDPKKNEGIAFGHKLVILQGGIYNLKKHRALKPKPPIEPTDDLEDEEHEEEEE